MINFEIIRHNSDKYITALRIRTRVLREPLGLSYSTADIEQEINDIHIIGYINSENSAKEIIAYLNLRKIDKQEFKIRQVAVLPEMQGNNYGRKIVKFAEEIARENGAKNIILHARETVVNFYKKLGYKVISDKFIEVNIPHFKMQKILNNFPD